MKSLYLAWRSPTKAKWYPVGRLTLNDHYEFEYIEGAKRAQEECNFVPLENFPEIGQKYQSDDLFPMFSNRLMPPNRPEYKHYLEYMNLPQNQDDPIVILARSGGRSVTDTFELFTQPEILDGSLHIHFFSHGVTHLPKTSLERIGKLEAGEPLKLMHDLQNVYDPHALCLRTDDTTSRWENDLHILGYIPRYFIKDILEILQSNPVDVRVEKVNPSPAPLRFRLLCNLTAVCPAGFQPFSDSVYDPIL